MHQNETETRQYQCMVFDKECMVHPEVFPTIAPFFEYLLQPLCFPQRQLEARNMSMHAATAAQAAAAAAAAAARLERRGRKQGRHTVQSPQNIDASITQCTGALKSYNRACACEDVKMHISRTEMKAY